MIEEMFKDMRERDDIKDCRSEEHRKRLTCYSENIEVQRKND